MDQVKKLINEVYQSFVTWIQTKYNR